MKLRTLTLISSLAALAWTGSAVAGDTLARFEGGIGVHPVAAATANATTGVVTVVPNTVHGVPPGGRPWAIQKLEARVKQDGRIRVNGEGLVLAATDAIGMRGGVLQVAASLFCGTSNTAFSSAAVPLSVGGDFSIRDQLVPMPPTVCANPVLLIRNATGGVLGAWFAAGTFEDEDD